MDDTLESSPRRSEHRAPLAFWPAALILGVFSLLAVWPPVIPGLPRAPRLVLLAGLLGATLAWLSSRHPRPHAPRGRPRRVRGAPARRPVVALASPDEMASSSAWLQIMSGPDAEHLTRGLFEAANALVGHGERLLVVDGARRLRFHDAMRRQAGPGLLECLAGELPLLETIQGGAEESLCFLPRGNPLRSELWPQLGRLLLEARPHFDRVVLALDFAVPHEVGPALEGLGAVGWWCHDGFTSILPAALAERIGIPLRNMRLPVELEVMPDPAAGRLAPFSLAAAPPWERPVAPRIEAPVVDCDLQVRERLRFLVWMRSVQAEGQRELEAQH